MAGGGAGTIMSMNRSLAKSLLALSYPLRFTAHLTDQSSLTGRRRRPSERLMD
jgi:hypothetical protein